MKDRLQLIKNKEVFISCIVPVFNEEEIISQFIPVLDGKLKTISQHYEIIVINDGSQDATLSRLVTLSQNYPVKVLSFSRNFGKEIALTAGLDCCKGDVAILLDGDFQHPVDLLPVFMEQWGAGYDMVYGVRANRNHEAFLKRYLANLFYWLMAKITQIDIPRDAGLCCT